MQFRYVVTGLAVVMSLAGCQRTSYDYNNNTSNNPGYTPPLQAQPVPPFSLAPCRHPVVLPAVSSRRHPLLRRLAALIWRLPLRRQRHSMSPRNPWLATGAFPMAAPIATCS